MSHIVVVGSSNTDMVVKTSSFPQPGETILGGNFYMFQGGKGANQAVAAARLGAEIAFICGVGDDLFGKNALEHYASEGMNLEGAFTIKGSATGVALITIDHKGENNIVVAPGANNRLSGAHLMKQTSLLEEASVILTQLETPMEVLITLVEQCRKLSKPLILNPAPARPLGPDVLEGLYLITPNQTEAKLLTGITVTDETTAEMAGRVFLEKGIKNLIITMGRGGAFFMNSSASFMSSAPDVHVMDTTAAGDVFNGALAVALSKEQSWEEAVAFAIKAAAISVTRMGAQNSAPYLHEMN